MPKPPYYTQGFNDKKPILKTEDQTSQDWKNRGRDFFPTETILFP